MNTQSRSKPAPAVSIVIPCKGRLPLLAQALESARRQTFRDFECLVVDDERSHETERAVAAKSGGDQRFRYSPRAGSASGGNVCRNQGLRAARGAFVVFLDSDDVLFEDCLAERMRDAADGGEIDARIYQAVKIHGAELTSELFNYDYPGADDTARFAGLDWPWQTTAAMISRRYLTERGLAWDEDLNTAQDVDFFLRILLSGARYEKLKRCDYGYRLSHSDDSVGQDSFGERKIGSYLRLVDKLARDPRPMRATEARRLAAGNLCYSLYFALRNRDAREQARSVLARMGAFGLKNRLAAQLLAANLRTRRHGFLHYKTLKLFQLAFPRTFKIVPTHDHRKPTAEEKGYAISPSARIRIINTSNESDTAQ